MGMMKPCAAALSLLAGLHRKDVRTHSRGAAIANEASAQLGRPTPANQVPDYGRGEEVEITIAVITAPTAGTVMTSTLLATVAARTCSDRRSAGSVASLSVTRDPLSRGFGERKSAGRRRVSRIERSSRRFYATVGKRRTSAWNSVGHTGCTFGRCARRTA